MVRNIGEFSTDPTRHGITKVPGHVSFTLDMQSPSTETLDQFDRFLRSKMAEVADRRGVVFDLGAATRAAPALMPPEIQSSLASAAVQCGVDHISLPSGGGHDCATFAEMGVSTGMIFIRNQNGSHNPDEHMDFADFCCAADVLTK